MTKLNEKESAYITTGKHKGRKCWIEKINYNHDPILYEVTVIAYNDEKECAEFLECAVYENELETVYEHDMRLMEL